MPNYFLHTDYVRNWNRHCGTLQSLVNVTMSPPAFTAHQLVEILRVIIITITGRETCLPADNLPDLKTGDIISHRDGQIFVLGNIPWHNYSFEAIDQGWLPRNDIIMNDHLKLQYKACAQCTWYDRFVS